MWLIVGLGNPGKKYERTRHNAGARAIAITEKIFDSTKKNSEKIICIRPTTYMNESGAAVAERAAFYKIKPERIIIAHDDLDFSLGTVKIQFNRSAAGHNGVADIITKLGTQAFHRVRVGIGPQPALIDAADFVLQKFSAKEEKKLSTVLETIPDLIKKIIAK